MSCHSPIRYNFADSAHTPTKMNANGVCVVVLAILVACVMWNMQRSIYHPEYRPTAMQRVPQYVSGMLNRFTSARQAQTGSGVQQVIDSLLSNETNDRIMAANKASINVHNPTVCTDASCENYKTGVSASDKAKNDDAVRAVMKRYPHALVMVWAPWCPHCHNAMPEVIKAAEEIDDPLVLVNSELVTPKMMTGPDAPAGNVSHFPFIAKDKQVFEGSMTAEGIKSFCKVVQDNAGGAASKVEAESVPPPSDETAAEPSPEEQLQMMF